MVRLQAAVLLIAAAGLVAGCGDHIKRPGSSDFVLSGTVSKLTSGGGEPLGGAQVTASVDRNHDGVIGSDESTVAASGEDGKYSLSMKVNEGERVVVKFAADGVAPVLKSFNAGPWAELPLNAAMREMESFDCSSEGDQRCALEGNKLSLTGLADGTWGEARVFNPENETNAFPGAFDDSQGNLLISGVFGSVKLEDGTGEVSKLDAPADLRMRVPEETWKLMVDLHPGDDRIQVPLYSFNDVSGDWERDGEGYLETSSGAVIPEAKLAEIRAGTFSEGVTASGQVKHFSYWNIDWPVDTKQCLTGVILGDDDKPAEGATVYISGVTYTGNSKPSTVGADGKFCADVMRSEAAGEDVDNDGVTGETQKVRIRVAYGGKLYDEGVYETKKEAATCDSGGCLDVGDLQLSSDKEVTPKLCKLHGTIRDNTGAARGDSTVYFVDESVPEEVRNDLCGFASLNCTLFAMSAEDGSYEVTTPVLDGATLYAFSVQSEAEITRTRLGVKTTDGCPESAVDLKMNDGVDSIKITVTVSGNQISWTPAQPLQSLSVFSSSGYRWEVEANDDSGFSGPVTYGTVPANASQQMPETGAPTPLASGDTVLTIITHESEHIPVVGYGETTAP